LCFKGRTDLRRLAHTTPENLSARAKTTEIANENPMLAIMRWNHLEVTVNHLEVGVSSSKIPPCDHSPPPALLSVLHLLVKLDAPNIASSEEKL